VFKQLFIILNATLLLGCNTLLLGSYGEQNQTLAAFAQRVERVFKFQNSMTNAVMLLEVEPAAAILDAEQKMHTVCEPLNEYASREMDGLSADFALQKRVEQTAISCEKAAQQLQNLFPSAH
jgi:hypothetical protein